jgi:hypothetical protein
METITRQVIKITKEYKLIKFILMVIKIIFIIKLKVNTVIIKYFIIKE